MVKKIGIGLASLVVVYLVSYAALHTSFKSVELSQAVAKATGPLVFDDPVAKTKTWCAMQCGEVPFAGFKCVMVCLTCTTDWGGGCSITIY